MIAKLRDVLRVYIDLQAKEVGGRLWSLFRVPHS
jgi:hypothetical protein